MNMNLTWKKRSGKHIVEEDLYLGSCRVGSINKIVRSKGKDFWNYSCLLPAVDRDYGIVTVKNDAKAELEFLVKCWLDRAGLSEEQSATR